MDIDINKYNPIIITIDGTASSGKGTLVSGLKERLNGYKLLDAGSMYRVLTQMSIYNNISPEMLSQEKAILEEFKEKNNFDFSLEGKLLINGAAIDMDELKSPEIGSLVSKFSGIEKVKRYIVGEQKDIIKRGREFGWILDGRCMGSAVALNAQIKFFTDAPIDVRSTWRHRQYEKKGRKDLSVKDVKVELRMRDKDDVGTKTFPLVNPEGAIQMKTSDFSIDEGQNKVWSDVLAYFVTKGKLRRE
jgi:cytidylate kinase